jgi:formylglycine-generating enzyme required for sulfatase activity
MLLAKIKTVMALSLMLSVVMLGNAVLLAWGRTGEKRNSVQNPAAKAELQAARGKSNDTKGPPKKFTNSLGMKFVWIPPGTFKMGSPESELARDEQEILHKVTLTKGFYLGVYPVTQEQWQAVMGKNPSRFKGEKNLPVETICWDDCQEFIKKLRAKDKKAYRLPTEAEWEYACRAGTTTPFYFGETISTDLVNYNGDWFAPYGNGKKGVFRNKTTPVGSFPANPWGLHDMHGNVWQWCQDWYGDYPQADVVDPQGADKNGGSRGHGRVQRGGSLHNPAERCRSAYRGWYSSDNRHYQFGCRLCFFPD